MLSTPANFKTQQHPTPSCKFSRQLPKSFVKLINHEEGFFIWGADTPDQEQASTCSVTQNQCSQHHYSGKHLREIYGNLLGSLLSYNEHRCAGHVLLLQRYLFLYWLKIKMVIYVLCFHTRPLQWFISSISQRFFAYIEELMWNPDSKVISNKPFPVLLPSAPHITKSLVSN